MNRKKVLKTCLIVFAVFLVIILFAFDSRLKVVKYNIKSEKISGKVTLALITDLHSCVYGENQSRLISEIEKVNPNAVLLGGDIFDDEYINTNSYDLINSLAGNYKMYYVSGNHEWWGEEIDEILEYLAKTGVTVLRGDTDILEIGENTLAVSGIDDPVVNGYNPYMSFDKQLKTVGENIEKENFNILLAHRPEFAEDYMEYDFDLVLAGHAHGGQFRIPFIMNGFFASNQGYFPEFAGGYYKFDKKSLIVSRGLSRENTKLPRIFNRPELVFVSVTND